LEEIPSLAEVGEGRNPISQTLRSLTDTTGAENIVKGHKMRVLNYTQDEQGRIKLKLGFDTFSQNLVKSTHSVLPTMP
jgi:hypothetical protein